ncbi:ATP synthase mitochondrial F1 complex assembly factor 1-like [Oopsacas minuta]|uniref:ATP synthase mitochondrial F1 complex assembly factor 1-like n=1 Tax=Oopsacas minuta TaxID=111878 RepID=A0AAV7K2P9_9METZ|nr:ATP synthase mitochondrial F1 complex assembly factor 1-like [Oopsacas minuta]
MNLSLFIKNVCNKITLSLVTPTVKLPIGYMCLSHDDTIRGMQDNPFFEKYKKQLHKVKNNSNNQIPRKIPNQPRINLNKNDTKSQSKQPLDSILDISKLLDNTSEEIADIWNSYHSNLDCIHGTLPADSYTLTSTQGTLCPYFIYPLPSDTGYKFMFQQFSNNQFHFTALEDYNSLKEHAPVYLSMSYYSELAKEKDIVLMAGKFDLEKMKTEEAQLLAHFVQLYYGQNNKERIELIRSFNFTPNLFDYKQLIQQFKQLTFM